MRLKTSEHNEQAIFFDSVLYEYRLDPTFSRELFFAVPNGAYFGGGGGARFAYIEKLKREGFSPGVSDILYLQPRGGFSYLSIEMKISSKKGRKGGGLSDDQSRFMEAARSAGARAVVCYGADEAIEVFRDYMGLMLQSRASDKKLSSPSMIRRA
jgi:hypothetical protein